MESITVTRPVIIKVRVTEGYKKVVAAELQKLVQQLDQEIQRLEYQGKYLQGQGVKLGIEKLPAAQQKINAEIQSKLQKKQQYLEKIKAIGQLKPGSEVIHGRVESLVDIKVGDNWNRIMNVEILIEDGQVLEIRQGFFDPHGRGDVISGD